MGGLEHAFSVLQQVPLSSDKVDSLGADIESWDHLFLDKRQVWRPCELLGTVGESQVRLRFRCGVKVKDAHHLIPFEASLVDQCGTVWVGNSRRKKGASQDVGAADRSKLAKAQMASRAADNEVAAYKATSEAWTLREELEGRQPRRDARKQWAGRKSKQTSGAKRLVFCTPLVTQRETFEIEEGNSLRSKRSW